MSLVQQVRTNACQVSRGTPPQRAGCALSVLMGWHNHSCSPNAASVVGPSGEVSITALKDIAPGEEVLISYTDVSEGYETRRKTLLEHYGFECKCTRCTDEQKAELKARMKQANKYRS